MLPPSGGMAPDCRRLLPKWPSSGPGLGTGAMPITVAQPPRWESHRELICCGSVRKGSFSIAFSLLSTKTEMEWKTAHGEEAFFGRRRILVDHARRKGAKKRGGESITPLLDENLAPPIRESSVESLSMAHGPRSPNSTSNKVTWSNCGSLPAFLSKRWRSLVTSVAQR
jgi:ECF sigma factor